MLNRVKMGWYAVLPYFTLYYFVPTGLMFIFGPHINFSNDGNAWLILAVVLLVLGLSALLSKLPIRFPLKSISRLPDLFSSNLFVIIFGLVFLPIAYKFSIDYGASFRYSGESIADSGPVAKLATLYRGFFAGFMLYNVIKMINFGYFSFLSRVGIFICTVNWILCANGAVDVMWALVGLLLALFGGGVKGLFVQESSKFEAKYFIKKVFIIIASIIGCVGVVFFGFANKMGFDDALVLFQSELMSRVVYYMYYRLSVSITSLEVVLNRGLDFDLYLQVIDSEIGILLYRLGVIFQFDYPSPAIEGVNRLNYLLIYKNVIRADAGATPGPIATFFYFPMIPFNLIFCSFYIAMVKNCYDLVINIDSNKRLTVLTMIFFTVANFALLHNPIAAFLKVGPELFKTLMVIYALACSLKLCRVAKNER